MTILNAANTTNDLQQASNLLQQVVNNFIVRPTGTPPGFLGVSGFLFDVIGTEELSLESDITDHYVEDNTAIQDHIALRPESFTLRGFIAELNDVFAQSLAAIQRVVNRLALVDSFIPSFTTQANQVYAAIADASAQAGEAINQAQNLYDLFSQKSTTATKQQNAFNFFYSMWLSRQFCTVETPWGIYENMAIDKVRATQNEETRVITDFSVTFKKIRTTNTLISVGETALAAGRAVDMLSSVVQKGQSKGQSASVSLLKQVFS